MIRYLCLFVHEAFDLAGLGISPAKTWWGREAGIITREDKAVYLSLESEAASAPESNAIPFLPETS